MGVNIETSQKDLKPIKEYSLFTTNILRDESMRRSVIERPFKLNVRPHQFNVRQDEKIKRYLI